MRWTNNRIDPRRIIKDHALINRTLLIDRSKMAAAGSPCTAFKNQTWNPDGTIRAGLTKCYCWDAQQAAPDKKHSLCMGTGYLEGYQKYGYKEVVISTPSTITKTPGIIISATDKPNDSFTMSSTTLVETVTTAQIPLVRFQDVSYFYARSKFVATDDRIKYFYRTTDTTLVPATNTVPAHTIETPWTEITMVDYASDLSTQKAADNYVWHLTGATWIKFQISFQKRLSTSPSPVFNSIRFRFRNMPNYGDIDSRFHYIRIPAFLAAREQSQQQITATNVGFKTDWPLTWWTLPEVAMDENDIIRFLVGENEGQTHVVDWTMKHQYGPHLQTLHRQFYTKFLREYNDLLGIVHLLN